MTYRYEVWFDGCVVAADAEYETEDDAYEEAYEDVASKMDEWNDPDVVWDDFDVRVYEEKTWGLYSDDYEEEEE